MKIKQIIVYPVKSLRGTALSSATLTKQGILYDRCFMLLKVRRDGTSPDYENMHVSCFPEMALFTTALTTDGLIRVTYTDPNDKSLRSLNIPLTPDTTGLEPLDINMHHSATKGLMMKPEYSQWFSSCFRYEVVLAYLGCNYRTVLGNIRPDAAVSNPQKSKALSGRPEKTRFSSWFSSLAAGIPGMPTTFHVAASGEDYKITFADCAPFLIISDTSVQNVSLRSEQEVDVTKFRPNIIIEGADEAWEEDFWAKLEMHKPDKGSAITMLLTGNCVRCLSLNVDYDTGEFIKGPAGQILKLLQKDRRIDAEQKYSPCFGRYAFLGSTADESILSVGDLVEVTERNKEHTVLKWPGFGSIAEDDLYPV